MERTARRRAAVMIGLAGVLGGAMVGLSSIDGVTATSPGHGSGSTGMASQSPGGTPSSGSTHSGSPTHSAPTHNATSAPTHNATSAPTRTPRFSPTPIGSPTPKGASTATPTPTPRNGSPVSSPTPKSGSSSTPTPHAGNTHNAKWPQDSRGWKDWNGGWQDPNWRQEHSRDSRHEQGFFRDRDRFCDTHDCDRFHFDEFRSEDNDFRHDCDVLISFHSVRALLDFLDGDSSLRDFFELHGDLYDFLVNHSDWSDDFDPDCTLIDLRL